MSTTGFRYPDLPENNLLLSNGLIAWYDYVTDTTYRSTIGAILAGVTNPDLVWNPEFEYTEGQTVSYNGKLWIATAEPDNLGQPPSDVSDFWNEEPDPAPVGTVTLETIQAAASPIILNQGTSRERFYRSDDIIDGIRTWQMVGVMDSSEFKYSFEINGAYVQTLPADWFITNVYNATWDDALKEWTPLSAGKYMASGAYFGAADGWRVEIHGPY